MRSGVAEVGGVCGNNERKIKATARDGQSSE